jgi:hypothetical protein
MVQPLDLRSFERLVEGASSEVYSREDVGAKKGEMLFLDLRFLFGGERVSEGEVEVGFDEFLVGAKKRAEGSTDGVAEVGY